MPVKPRNSASCQACLPDMGSTSSLSSQARLVTILDKEGSFLAWNLSMEKLKRNLPEARRAQEFLSAPSQILFDEFLKKALQERRENRPALSFPLKAAGVISPACSFPCLTTGYCSSGNPSIISADLETISAELEMIKHSLAIKETELKAVLAQADEVSHTDALTSSPTASAFERPAA